MGFGPFPAGYRHRREIVRHRRCKRCHERYPLRDEYFTHSAKAWSTVCKICHANPPMRRCPRCHKAFPRDERAFAPLAKGFDVNCRDCRKAIETAKERRGQDGPMAIDPVLVSTLGKAIDRYEATGRDYGSAERRELERLLIAYGSAITWHGTVWRWRKEDESIVRYPVRIPQKRP